MIKARLDIHKTKALDPRKLRFLVDCLFSLQGSHLICLWYFCKGKSQIAILFSVNMPLFQHLS